MTDFYDNLIRSIYNDYESIEAKIIGTIPDWLNGSLLRNGPGRYRFGEKTYKHLFDGMACVNKFEIENGRVLFTSKLLKTETMKRNLEKNSLYAMFGTEDLCSTIFNRFKVFFERREFSVYDNVNVNVVPFGDNQLYALSETYMVVRIDPKTLDIINTENLTHHLKPTYSIIGHPHIDEKGNWISMGMQPIPIPRPFDLTYDFMSFNGGQTNVRNVCENAKLIARVPSSHYFGLSYFHSFGLTKTYIVFLEQSLILDCKTMALNLCINKSVSTAISMNKSFQTKIHLINRTTGEIVKHKYYTDSQFSFHHINAYETEDDTNQIVIDICSYSDIDLTNFTYQERLNEETEEFLQKSKAYARRIFVPLTNLTGDKTYCKIVDLNSLVTIELPTINYASYNTKPYKYVYGVGLANPPYSIIKINVEKYNDYIQAVIKSDNTRVLPSEPIFVENPNGTSEDDGVILSLVLGDKYDFLIILDAKTLEEVARAELPDNIKSSYTFHGFFANKKYEQIGIILGLLGEED